MAARTDVGHQWGTRMFAAALGVASLAGLIVFAPWRPPEIVSDAWFLIANFGGMAPAELATVFVPRADFWYRPLTYTGYWVEWHVFGISPIGYYLVELSAHVLASVLIGALALSLVRNRWAALATGVVFLFALQANETVWDYGSLHRVLSAVVVPASVLAYVHQRRRIALLGALMALLVDEAGVIVLPLLVGCELLFRVERQTWRHAITAAARRLAPLVALTLAYIAARLWAGGVFNELSTPCRSLSCIAVGAAEYLNRLVVRGDDLLRLLWTDRPVFVLVVGVLGMAALALVAPWRWTNWRPLAYGILWAALGSALFILTLWPYVADRFVYVPVMGMALAIGAVVGGVFDIWPRAARARRGALVAAGALLLIWVFVGAVSLADRGRRWVDAGEFARDLRADLYALLPTPAPGTQVLLWNLPRMQTPMFLPGNTGPYVYMNGMQWAMRLAYGWPTDVDLPSHPELYPVQADRPVLEFEVVDGHVVPRTTD